MDENLKLVAEFMKLNLPASRLVSVASALKDVAPIFWGFHEAETIRPMLLMHEPFLVCDPRK